MLMERQDVVLNRVRYLRIVREFREAGYTDETYVHTNHAIPKCWQDNTSRLKIPFSKGNLRIVELYDHWVCTIITIWVRPLVRPLAVRENVHSSWPHSIFWSHFACMSFPNHWYAKPLFYGRGFHSNWQTFTLAMRITVCWFHVT